MIFLIFEKMKRNFWDQVRFVPFLMVSTLIMLGVRFHEMGQKLSDWLQPSFFLYGSPVKAATPLNASSPSPSKGEGKAQIIPMEKLSDSSAPSENETPLKENTSEKFDLLNLSPEEFEVVQRILTEGKALEEKKENHLHQAKMEVLNKNILLKIEQLQKLKLILEKTITQQEKKNHSNLLELVKMYESMKPQEAAQIFSNLDLDVTLSIFRQMKGKKASAILASLPPQNAGQITSALAQENEQMKEIQS
jgi:flagellar motility protein MotE (MotC chaperone)